ncbi:hypothetical protein F3K40_42850 [Streptomyces sp. LBUM 1478]|uniref:hypothetical protein n=1 Tax=Streptomyces TaxID=1883 RepID=UPI000A4B8CE1|nr:hypothetical protein [Streptomyces scabiei]MBP5873054.1 hypothetical protein [Streptomyces sp. LBUM 1485]MBP5910641.1 hypothetical protein [Streptomyces sp. LBUM 1478]MDX3030710.1 hypothetical protein [Streptomyces scabiei]MDX3176826.1 hypothetical protein [Streptomyces scabiei]MDX3280413.1 hypothetical protein [Streptomyces scabiei]
MSDRLWRPLRGCRQEAPGPYAHVNELPWREIPLGHRTRAHHRDEIRRLKVAVFRHVDCPGTRQAIQVVCWHRDLSAGKPTMERLYLITGLTGTASSPTAPIGVTARAS